ncbi:MAG TPA: hypothetical protein VG916_08890 [Gemmatimonadaceae bacterium]|nr:hypothetical protein [Gemmatimonadaceae bacterium]
MRPFLLIAAAALCAAPAYAQENYEIQVYPSETADPHTTLFEFHTNYTGKGSPRIGSLLATDGAVHETLEITHGFNSVFELGFYVFTAVPKDGGWQFVGSHIRPRIRAPESWHLPVGLSLSTEFGPTDRKFDPSEFGIEVRPIVDQEIGKFYWAFNPNVEWSMKGPEAGKGVDGMNFNPSIKLAWKLDPRYSAGVEYYGTTGTLSRMSPSGEQDHMLYPSLDFFLDPNYELNVGYGVRIGGSGDENIFKVIFGRRIGW